jgi:hypothetical protein
MAVNPLLQWSLNLKLKVTQDHINRGVRNNCWHCPIALAFKELGLSTTVGRTEVCYEDIDSFYTLPLPAEATQFTFNFDAGFAVQPFECEVEIDLPDLGW